MSTSQLPTPDYIICPSFTIRLEGSTWDTHFTFPSTFTHLYNNQLALRVSRNPNYVLRHMVHYEGRSTRQSFRSGFTLGWADFILEINLDYGDHRSFFFTRISSFTVALFENNGVSKNSLYANNFFIDMSSTSQQPKTAPLKRAVQSTRPTNKFSPVQLVPRTAPMPSPNLAPQRRQSIHQLVPLAKTRQYTLTLPKSFFTATGMHRMDSVILSNAEGDTWQIILGECRLGKGWNDFWKDNQLEVCQIVMLRCSFNTDGSIFDLKVNHDTNI